MSHKIVVLLDNHESRSMVKSVCEENGFKFEEFEELVKFQVDHMGSQHRGRLWANFDDILDRIKIEKEE